MIRTESRGAHHVYGEARVTAADGMGATLQYFRSGDTPADASSSQDGLLVLRATKHGLDTATLYVHDVPRDALIAALRELADDIERADA